MRTDCDRELQKPMQRLWNKFRNFHFIVCILLDNSSTPAEDSCLKTCYDGRGFPQGRQKAEQTHKQAGSKRWMLLGLELESPSRRKETSREKRGATPSTRQTKSLPSMQPLLSLQSRHSGPCLACPRRQFVDLRILRRRQGQRLNATRSLLAGPSGDATLLVSWPRNSNIPARKPRIRPGLDVCGAAQVRRIATGSPLIEALCRSSLQLSI